MAPEYYHKGEISTKSDIYSLGILILEVVTGERNHKARGDISGEQFIETVRKTFIFCRRLATHIGKKSVLPVYFTVFVVTLPFRYVKIGPQCQH